MENQKEKPVLMFIFSTALNNHGTKQDVVIKKLSYVKV